MGSEAGREIIEKELSTGLVIAGAYANKLRRTLFAQLRDLVKQNKEFAREVARASGEINRLLYIILVENLKCDKGDVVRVRIKYRVNLKEWRIIWDYDTLRIEYFKRQPDEEVMKIARKILEEKLAEIQEQYREAPSREEAEKILRGEVKTPEEEWGVEREKTEEKTLEVMGTTQPIAVEERIEERKIPAEKPFPETAISSITPIGETLSGGAIFRLANEANESTGLVSLESHAGGWLIEAIVLHGGKAYRATSRAKYDKKTYLEKPEALLEEIKGLKFIEISREDAERIIRGKMEAIT